MQSQHKASGFAGSTAKIIEILNEQRRGFVSVVATQRGRRKEHWLPSDDAERLASILAKYDGSWCIEFTPTTFSECSRTRSAAYTPRLLHAELWDEGDNFEQAWAVGMRGKPWKMWEGDYGERVCVWKAPPDCTVDRIEFLNSGYVHVDEDDFSFAKVTTLMPIPRDPPTALDLCRRYGVKLGSAYFMPLTRGTDKRSDILWKVAMACAEAHVPSFVTERILELTPAFVDKRSERGNRWALNELRRLVGKCPNVVRNRETKRTRVMSAGPV